MAIFDEPEDPQPHVPAVPKTLIPRVDLEIEGIQFTGGEENAIDIIQWVASESGAIWWQPHVAAVQEEFQGSDEIPEQLFIETLEGTMAANVGDWVIKGTIGEFYPVKPAVIAVKYTIQED